MARFQAPLYPVCLAQRTTQESGGDIARIEENKLGGEQRRSRARGHKALRSPRGHKPLFIRHGTSGNSRPGV